MDIELRVKHPDEVISQAELDEFKWFLQAVVHRKYQGGARYGKIQRRQKYMTRLSKELRAYRRDGNLEQLFNIAVYAFLESYAPENKNFHFDPTVDSVTRKEMGT